MNYESKAIKIPRIQANNAKTGLTVQVGNLVNIQGDATKEIIPEIKQASENVLDRLTKSLQKSGVSVNFKG